MKKLTLSLLVLLGLSFSAQAELRINVTEGTFKPVPIAITPFDGGGDPELARVGQEITSVIINDLQSCGLFKVVDQAAYIQTARDVMTQPRFADWRVLHAEALVGGLLRRNGNGFEIDFRLFDIFTETQLAGLSMGSEPTNWRHVAHKIADEIYEKITGDKGYFDTRIVYIHESGPEMNRKYRLAIMDQDGENHQFLTSGNSMVLTPRFSPDRTKIAYLDFGHMNKNPNLHIFNIQTGQTESLGEIQGLKMSPRFSINGDHLLFSIADRGVTSLYTMDLATKTMRRLTSSAGAIDVSPCYSHDGGKIVYVSDRGGKPQLYIKGAGEGDGTRISFSQGRYDNPVWSPRGDLICFTRQNGNTFYIGVMRPDGSGERMLDSGYLLEGPTWAPNGREIMYTCQPSSNSKVMLASVDIVGFNKRKVNIPGEGSYPAW
jgi:TolB protein